MPTTSFSSVETYPAINGFLERQATPTAEWLALDDQSDWRPCPENAASGFICSRRPLLKSEEKLGW